MNGGEGKGEGPGRERERETEEGNEGREGKKGKSMVTAKERAESGNRCIRTLVKISGNVGVPSLETCLHSDEGQERGPGAG
eukprot:1392806-Pleurochrysis_carterae.AAC.1